MEFQCGVVIGGMGGDTDRTVGPKPDGEARILSTLFNAVVAFLDGQGWEIVADQFVFLGGKWGDVTVAGPYKFRVFVAGSQLQDALVGEPQGCGEPLFVRSGFPNLASRGITQKQAGISVEFQ